MSVYKDIFDQEAIKNNPKILESAADNLNLAKHQLEDSSLVGEAFYKFYSRLRKREIGRAHV